jgi:hypothetical protein
MVLVRMAARNSSSLIVVGQASASTQICKISSLICLAIGILGLSIVHHQYRIAIRYFHQALAAHRLLATSFDPCLKIHRKQVRGIGQAYPMYSLHPVVVFNPNCYRSVHRNWSRAGSSMQSPKIQDTPDVHRVYQFPSMNQHRSTSRVYGYDIWSATS